MKKLLMTAHLLACCGILAGCGDDADPEQSGLLTAEINGNEFVADRVDGFFYTDIDQVEVIGYKSNEEEGIVFTFDSADVEEGETYDVQDLNVLVTYVDENGVTFFPTEGEVTITKLTDTRFEASFEFTGQNVSGDDVIVTDGVVKSNLEHDN